MSHEDARETKLDPELASSLRDMSERGLEPDRDLWPGLKRQIVSADRVRRPAWRSIAAAVVLVGSVAGALWMLRPPRPVHGFEALASSRSPEQLPQAASAEFRQAFTSYLDERERVLGLIGERLRHYPPEVADEIRHSLEAIERALKEIEASVAVAAPDPATEARLVQLYELELRLAGVVSERLRGSPGEGV